MRYAGSLGAVFLMSCPFGHAELVDAPPLVVEPLRHPVGSHGGTLLRVLDPAETGVDKPNLFSDPRMWGARFRELTLGAVETGIAVADFNGDGRPDLFSVSKNGPCSLYLQTSDWRFEDVAERAGVTGLLEGSMPSNTGVSVADVNADGLPDLYLCRYELPNLLWINAGDGTFREEAAVRGLAVKDASVHATWADYDRDGAIDAYLVTNILDFSKAPQGRRDYLFRNRGDGTFEEVTKAAGIWGLTQGHTALWTDFNSDGWPDLYVANDFETPDRLYLNRGDGTFSDVIDERLPHATYFSMGADSGDINNDGLVDLFITDMRDRTHREFMAGMEEVGRGLWEQERVSKLIPQYTWNALYLNSGYDRFLEAAHLAGLQATGWTWAARLVDLDNDGWLDAFVTAGMVRNFIDADLLDRQKVAPDLASRARVWKNAPERREVPLVFRNRGDLTFEDVSAAWGMDRAAVAFGCAAADLDGDGDLDLVFSNYNEPPALVRNEASSGGRVVLRLKGRGGNTAALGSQVRLRAGGVTQIRQVFTERGITASEPADPHFGLGSTERVDELTITWPDGQVSRLEDLPTGVRVTLRQPDGGATPGEARFHSPPAEAALFREEKASGLDFTHQLTPFDELTRQRLLPRRLHGRSPPLATADVNGDGIDDVFIGGSAGQEGRLFLGKIDGTFEPSRSQPWAADTAATHAGAVFMDVNRDGKPDLVVARGGVENAPGARALNDILYLNDGYGAFTMETGAMPEDAAATQALAVGDFDGDGWTDLFVGGRHVPGAYPEVPPSFLYRNAGGRMVDVTAEEAPVLAGVGMVTATVFADLADDLAPELVVATEWGAVRVFSRNGGRFIDRTAALGLDAVRGWWNCIAVADVNADGLQDIIAGNLGLNTKYRAGAENPVELYHGDFDGNGRMHLVESYFQQGRRVPVRGRSKLAYAFPWLTKAFPTFRAYGDATLDDLFGDRLGRVGRLEANELRSGVFLQRRDGKFLFQPFPNEAQMAPIQALAAADFNGDGHLDLAAVGNHFFPEPTTGRFDGAQGWVLLGDGAAGWKVLWPNASGFHVPSDSRSVAVLKHPETGRLRLVASEAEQPVRVFDLR